MRDLASFCAMTRVLETLSPAPFRKLAKNI
jgi:hypothetical protein